RRSDRIRRRMPFVWTGYTLSNIAKPLVAIAAAWGWVLGARVLNRTGKGIRTAPRDALLRDSSDPGQAGTVFGCDRFMDSMGAVIGPLLALALLEAGLSYRQVIAVAVVPALLTMLALRKVVDVVASGHAAVPPPHARMADLGRPFWSFTAAWTVFAGQLCRCLPAPSRARPRARRFRGGARLCALQRPLLGPVLAARLAQRQDREAPRARGRAAGVRRGLRGVRSGELRRRRLAADGRVRGVHRRHRRRRQGVRLGSVTGCLPSHRAGRLPPCDGRRRRGGQPDRRPALAGGRAGRGVRARSRRRPAGTGRDGRAAAWRLLGQQAGAEARRPGRAEPRVGGVRVGRLGDGHTDSVASATSSATSRRSRLAFHTCSCRWDPVPFSIIHSIRAR